MRDLLLCLLLCIAPAVATAQTGHHLGGAFVEDTAYSGAPWADGVVHRSGTATLPMATGFEHDIISQMIVTSDGTRLVSSGRLSGTVVAQDPTTGERQWATSLGGESYGLAVAGGVLVAAVASPAEAVVLDVSTGGILRRVSLGGSPVRVDISDDGTLAAVGVLGNQIALIDVEAGVVLRVIDVPFRSLLDGRLASVNRQYSEFTRFALTADGRRLVVGGDSELQTYDTATGSVVSSVPLANTVWGLDVSDGGIAAVVTGFWLTSDRTLLLVDIETGSASTTDLGQGAGGPDVVVAPDGASAVVLIGPNAVAVTPGATPERVELGLAERMTAIGNGRAATWADGVSSQIDLAEQEVLRSVDLPPPGAFGYEIASQMSSGGNGDLVTWTFRLERAEALSYASAERTQFDLGGAAGLDAPRRIAVSPSGDRVAVVHAASGRVAVVDVASRQIVGEFSAGSRIPESSAFVAEDQLVVVGNDYLFYPAPVVARIDVATGEILQQISTGRTDARAVFVRGDRVYVQSRVDQILDVYDLSSGELVHLTSHDAGGSPYSNDLALTPLYIGVSPTGRHSVGVDLSGSGEIVIVDLDSGERTVIAANLEIGQVAFSSDGLRAGVASLDGTFYLIRLTDSPALLTTTALGHSTSVVTYDASEDVFVAGSRWSFPEVLIDIDARAGAYVSERALPGDFNPHALYWSEQTGVVATGVWRQPSGASGGAGVYSDTAYERVAGDAGESVLIPARGEAIVTIPGRDVLEIVQASPVHTDPVPGIGAHRLTMLGNPSASGLRVRLDGPASASLRVEVVDVLGRVVARLHSGPFSGASRDLTWIDAPTGSYLVRVAGTNVTVRASVLR